MLNSYVWRGEGGRGGMEGDGRQEGKVMEREWKMRRGIGHHHFVGQSQF